MASTCDVQHSVSKFLVVMTTWQFVRPGVPLLITHTLPGRSLRPICPAVARFKPQCEVADAHRKRAAFPQPTSMKLSQVQHLPVLMSYTERRPTQQRGKHLSEGGGFLRKSLTVQRRMCRSVIPNCNPIGQEIRKMPVEIHLHPNGSTNVTESMFHKLNFARRNCVKDYHNEFRENSTEV